MKLTNKQILNFKNISGFKNEGYDIIDLTTDIERFINALLKQELIITVNYSATRATRARVFCLIKGNYSKRKNLLNFNFMYQTFKYYNKNKDYFYQNGINDVVVFLVDDFLIHLKECGIISDKMMDKALKESFNVHKIYN